jgi:N-acetylneuraminic acid mutarotase
MSRSLGFFALVCLVGVGCGPSGDNAAVPAGESHASAWAAMAPVPEPRTEVSVTRLDDRIYLLGGFGEPADPEADERPPAPRTLWVYHPTEDRWEEAGEIPNGTHHAGFVSVGDRLFLVGGYRENTFEPTGQVHIYDPGTGVWTEGTPMPTPRGALAYAVLDGRIHTLGGTVLDKDRLDHERHGTDSPDASVGTHEVYDPESDSWERLPRMPTARNHHAAETVDGVIVVSGGRAGRDFTMTVTEVWDPRERAWREGAPLPTGRSGVAAASLGGWFYLFGGETFDPGDQRTFDDAERYRPGEDVWEVLEPMPSARHGLGAAAVDGAIYVISGGPGPGFTYGTANERYLDP